MLRYRIVERVAYRLIDLGVMRFRIEEALKRAQLRSFQQRLPQTEA